MCADLTYGLADFLKVFAAVRRLAIDFATRQGYGGTYGDRSVGESSLRDLT